MKGSGLELQHQIFTALPSLSHQWRNTNFNRNHHNFHVHRLATASRCRRRPRLICNAAAASPSPSIPGSPDQIFDGRTGKKSKKVAGIEQDELLDPTQLADPDSCFCEFQGVQIHHKVYDPQSQVDDGSATISAQFAPGTKKLGFPMVLLHGFGASVFSWNRVMKPFAHLIGSKVLAFDRPAFGLTSRLHKPFKSDDSKPLNPYSMAFSVLATLYFLDSLAAEKTILVGHSAGSLVALNSYFEAPERVAALILVAPALFAPLSAPKSREDSKKSEAGQESSNSGSQFAKFLKIITRFSKRVVQAITGILQGMTSMLNSLYKKALSAILRSALGITLVRMAIDKFGVAGVRSAWYDANQVTEHILRGYTKPLRSKGWDRALVEFAAAMLLGDGSESKPPLEKRLHEIKCPVLIVTGDTDRIVPAWNAKRLSEAIPGSMFELIKNCGHLPHEEKPEEFVSVVARFLQRAFGGVEEENLTLQGAVVT